MDGIYGTTGNLYGVFLVTVGIVGCGVAGTTGVAEAAGGLAANNTGKASGVAGATTDVVGMSGLTASG